MKLLPILLIAINTVAVYVQFHKVWAFSNIVVLILATAAGFFARASVTHDDKVRASIESRYGYKFAPKSAFDYLVVISGVFSLSYIVSSIILGLKGLWEWM